MPGDGFPDAATTLERSEAPAQVLRDEIGRGRLLLEEEAKRLGRRLVGD
jgi:hypothetical protein